MRTWIVGLLAVVVSLLALRLAPVEGGGARAKKIVLLGMDRDHGPGEHEYMAGLAILAECLKQTPGVEVQVVKLGKTLPADTRFLEDANAVVCFLRRAGDFFRKTPPRARLEEVLKKGTGFVCLHWAVEGDKAVGAPFMAALGGYYEPGYSTNPHNTATVKPADPSSPIARGWKPFEARDEFYFKIRLLPDAKPAILASSLKDRQKKEYKDETIGWTYERKDSKGPLGPGRSFGFTGCHFHVNFGIPEFRRLIANAVLWTADVPVPEQGAPVALTAPVPKVP